MESLHIADLTLTRKTLFHKQWSVVVNENSIKYWEKNVKYSEHVYCQVSPFSTESLSGFSDDLNK